MDLRSYFRKIRDVEVNITEPHTFISSLETSDGGKAGLITEVPRDVAAKMIVEGRACLATKTEREQFLQSQANARLIAKKADLAQRLQLTIVSDGETLRPASDGRTGGVPANKK